MGLFVTLEGGEGSGKSTQIQRLRERLSAKGHDVITTREPGGTIEAEKIRDLLVHRDGGNWTPMAEILLLFAGRQMHVENLIKPALAEGKIVLCDRFTDSTRAYQSYGHGMELSLVNKVADIAIDGFAPDITFIMDLPVEIGLQRAGRRLEDDNSGEDRFEQLDISFHERLRGGYLDIAKNDSKRCCIIDAAQDIDAITDELEQKILDHV